jgi:threonine aldolase
MIDLRRDTITLPDAQMKEAAFDAILGDSIYGEDPNQVALEGLAAEITGMDSAIYLPSGTMGNLAALLAHTNPGDEIILEMNAHIRTSESGGAGCVAGVMTHPILGADGIPNSSQAKAAIRPDDVHYPRTSLICLEIPHYRYGGIVPPLTQVKAIISLAKDESIPIHLDGARIFNACTHLALDVRQLIDGVDSIMISLSKGLGAPVGSVLCGSKSFIDRAKRYRKMLGGGMRQTGWLCACGIVALSSRNIRKLAVDHELAKRLANGLDVIHGFSVDTARVHTNFVILDCAESTTSIPEILEILRLNEILATQIGDRKIRFVVSKQVTSDDIDYVLSVFRGAMG